MAETSKLSQEEKLALMTDEEKAAWGFQVGESLTDKQTRDEAENPSGDPKAGLGPLQRRIK